ncbi:ATP-grasp domain-containing protein [Pseudomonas siliginis]|uniref:ATP-grasp domain-containing protein n=1 Tax=Pseudomonas siliginis TaxID=2842346 RepID=UPI00209279DE|nr:hypothetical protein [Pseudomonas siliginis]UST93240.1 hypothetical protein NF679_14640 [Pseudomonas siliginis]
MKPIVILTTKDDLHALVVQKRLLDKYSSPCSVIDTDDLCGVIKVSIDVNKSKFSHAPDSTLDISKVGAVWFRRIAHKQRASFENPAQSDTASNDWRLTILGAFLRDFEGAWVSHPISTFLAENKITQLCKAKEAGLTIPDTLISNSPEEIRRFFNINHGGLIAKPLGGTKLEQIETIKISDANLLNEKSILAAPIIYQQLIEGTKHLRINIFGSRFFTFILESQDLDWRSNYDLKYKLYDLPDSIAQKLTGLLHSLNLKMGIVDCKVDKDGNIYFLEVNPQGQFLFLEPLAGIPLSEHFADFLFHQANI